MGWGSRRLDGLRFGAILHDIGKIFIQESILTKSGPLTDEEWKEIKLHPVTGAEMIKDISYLTSARPVVRHHHERWDGGGYPDRLAGETIPLEARIVSVADSFDAMTTTRSYHPARSLEAACQEIIACSGTQYDPAVVEAFRKAWENNEIQAIAAKHKA